MENFPGWAPMMERLWPAVSLNLVAATLAWVGRAVSGTGALVGAGLGVTVYLTLDWRGYLVFASFVVLGSAVTRWRYPEKAQRGLAQERGGARGGRHALANCALGVGCAVLAWWFDSPALRWAFVGAFAAALADTVGSELGPLYGRRPILLPSGRRVPPGTEGAVSGEGTLLGLVAAALLGAEAGLSGLLPLRGIGWIVLAAGLGSLAESMVAAVGNRRGVSNEALNLLTTLVGAVVAGWGGVGR
ncbi:MAG TPA: DUF92 domain-containing protein [Armatimonadetes bacterium]|nr:DUF92 domain-containing protein [Armatimonadota bacterium]